MFPLCRWGRARNERGAVFNGRGLLHLWLLPALLVPLVLNAADPAIQKALPSAVRIYASDLPSGATTDGAGVVIARGQILTAAHVVRDRDEIFVLVDDGTKTISYQAMVKKKDTSMDLALLEVLGGYEPALLPTATRQDALPEIGDEIFVVGNPLGFSRCLVRGNISISGNEKGVDYFFIAASSRPGTSGGPVFNKDGMLLGVVVKEHKDGFFGECVPVTEINRFLDPNLKEGCLFVESKTVNIAIGTLGVPKALEVIKAPLETGLKPKDTILTVCDHPVEDPDDLVRIVRRKAVGSKVNLSILRNGEFLTVNPTVQELK